MAENLFAKYCGLNAISGMYVEKEECDQLLSLANPNEKLIVVIPINADTDWVYGQCNFLHEQDHIGNFKFSNTRDALRDQKVLPALINAHGVDAILFTSAAQYDWFSNEVAHKKYRSFFSLLKKGPAGYIRK